MKLTEILCGKDLLKIKKIKIRDELMPEKNKSYIVLWEFTPINKEKVKYVRIQKWKHNGKITAEDKTEGVKSFKKALLEINGAICRQDNSSDNEKCSVTCENV